MGRKIKFTPTADSQYGALEDAPSQAALFAQAQKALGFLEIGPRHPGLHTHEFTSLMGVNGEKVFEACAHNKTPGTYCIFWQYGPDEIKDKKRISAIAILAITSHP
jgi:hypothetical protein